MKKIFYLFLTILITITLTSCKEDVNNSSFTFANLTGENIINVSVDDSNYEGIKNDSDFSVITEDGECSLDNNVLSISKGGSYTLSGALDGYIKVSAPSTAEVELILNGVSIESEDNSPILILSAKKVKIKSKNKSYNVITDNRSIKTSDNEAQGEGAIYAKCDLTLSGKGTLVVLANYNNGVHTTKDLTIKNVSLPPKLIFC